MNSSDSRTGLRCAPVAQAATQPMAAASSTAPATSLSRCQPAITVAAPTAATPAAPGTANHHRTRGGSTSRNATSSPAAAVTWPLGKLLCVVEPAMSRSGRGSTSLNSLAVAIAAANATAPAIPARHRPPSAPMTSTATSSPASTIGSPVTASSSTARE
ncbi:hypothetical protein LZ318_38710 [Saccharopolyspora indica]|nr:hypothetical protein [Saccharopolyspora indica]MDA3642707.1 hypothetical protein [Saccharopolyspora indica]